MLMGIRLVLQMDLCPASEGARLTAFPWVSTFVRWYVILISFTSFFRMMFRWLKLTNGLCISTSRVLLNITGVGILVSSWHLFNSTNDHNILMYDWTCSLGDFGFSHPSLNLAVEQHSEGTFNWMIPEHVEADEFTMTTAGDV